MERLTEKNPAWIDDELYASACEPDDETIDAVYRKLKAYEDAEEQGLLLRLPCKVGDIVYYVYNNRVMSSEILSVKYHAEDEIHKKLTVDFEGIPAEIDFNTISKTIFLTREEAEAKLKEEEMEDDYER